jgi:hypothetical protein
VAQLGIYYQSAQPTVTAPSFTGALWFNTNTNMLKILSSSNQWLDVLSSELDYGGLLNRGGGNMSGAITGAHGLLPIADSPMTGTATLNGIDIVTKADLQDAVDSLMAQFTSTTSSSGTSSSSTSSGKDVAWTQGVTSVTTSGNSWWTSNIAYPSFSSAVSGNVTPSAAQIAVIAAPADYTHPPWGGESNQLYIAVQKDVATAKWQAFMKNVNTGATVGISLNYIMIAVR